MKAVTKKYTFNYFKEEIWYVNRLFAKSQGRKEKERI
jgi:hypothetical protein